MARQQIIELETNFIAKGLVLLERIFDSNVVFLKSESKIELKIAILAPKMIPNM